MGILRRFLLLPSLHSLRKKTKIKFHYTNLYSVQSEQIWHIPSICPVEEISSSGISEWSNSLFLSVNLTNINTLGRDSSVCCISYYTSEPSWMMLHEWLTLIFFRRYCDYILSWKKKLLWFQLHIFLLKNDSQVKYVNLKRKLSKKQFLKWHSFHWFYILSSFHFTLWPWNYVK